MNREPFELCRGGKALAAKLAGDEELCSVTLPLHGESRRVEQRRNKALLGFCNTLSTAHNVKLLCTSLVSAHQPLSARSKRGKSDQLLCGAKTNSTNCELRKCAGRDSMPEGKTDPGDAVDAGGRVPLRSFPTPSPTAPRRWWWCSGGELFPLVRNTLGG